MTLCRTLTLGTAASAAWVCAIAISPASAQLVDPTQLGASQVRLPLVASRAAAMGGAGAALSVDPTAAFFNPAGLALLQGASLSISANAYGGYFATHDEVYGFTPDGQLETADFEASGTKAFPSAAVYAYQLGRPGSGLTVAAGVFVPHDLQASGGYLLNRSDAIAGVAEQFEVAITAREYLASLALGYQIGENLAVGAAVYGRYASGSRAESRISASRTDDPRFNDITQLRLSYAINHASVFGLAGALATFDGLQLGLWLRSPSLALGSSGSFRETFAFTSANPEDGFISQSAFEEGKGLEVNDRVPFGVGLGIAYVAPKRFAVSAEADWYAPIPDRPLMEETGAMGRLFEPGSREADDFSFRSFRTRATSTLDLKAGAEWYATESFAVRAGGFLGLPNAEALPDLPPIKDQTAARVTVFGGTLGVGLGTPPLETLVGLNVALAKGDGVSNLEDTAPSGERLNPDTGKLRDVNELAFTFFLAGTVDVTSELTEKEEAP